MNKQIIIDGKKFELVPVKPVKYSVGTKFAYTGETIYVISKIESGEVYITLENSKRVIAIYPEMDVSELFEKGSWVVVEEKLERKPLFTTDDGKDIFEGDKIWFASSERLLSEFGIECLTKMNMNIFTSDVKCFSTKEAAEKYVLDCKPTYSPNQIFKALNKANNKIEDFLKNLGLVDTI